MFAPLPIPVTCAPAVRGAVFSGRSQWPPAAATRLRFAGRHSNRSMPNNPTFIPSPAPMRPVLAALLIALACACAPRPAAGQIPGLEVEGYAELNYQHFRWDTDSSRRARIDLERATLEATYRLSKTIVLEGEVEFEHGGTGSTMEFDRFEEFGEYEQEVEKGGEVSIEKLAVAFMLAPEINVRAGHIYVPIGLVNSNYEPGDYYTATRSESETAIIPATWHETGVELFGRLGALSYRVLLVNGLDATGFASSSWIKHGAQGRFETVNAENLALALRTDYDLAPGVRAGLSVYTGNSADNRPKPDLKVPARVTIAEAHASAATGPLTLRGEALFGHLQNAEAVSVANRNLSANLNVKRNPVGSRALACFAEAGVDLFALFGASQACAPTVGAPTVGAPGTGRADDAGARREPGGEHAERADDAPQRLDLFARVDYYDSMFGTEGTIFDNPRWERLSVTGGLNYRPIDHVIIKAQYTHRALGTQPRLYERTAALGLGVEF